MFFSNVPRQKIGVFNQIFRPRLSGRRDNEKFKYMFRLTNEVSVQGNRISLHETFSPNGLSDRTSWFVKFSPNGLLDRTSWFVNDTFVNIPSLLLKNTLRLLIRDDIFTKL